MLKLHCSIPVAQTLQKLHQTSESADSLHSDATRLIKGQQLFRAELGLDPAPHRSDPSHVFNLWPQVRGECNPDQSQEQPEDDLT